ncbi:MAG TPA: CotH kinase family protein, partial [Chthoniobacteraceae bacterium]|nr:CotH kinase family protein [Chthoniobacteraceae bacterium]
MHRKSPCIVPRLLYVLPLVWEVCASFVWAAPEWKEVYDPFTVRTLYLQLDPSDWDRVRHDVPVEGQTEGQERAQAWFNDEGESQILVEIRRKGATDPALPSEANPQKVSLKVDFNAIVAGQEWHGLRKLSLDNGGDGGPLNEGFAWQVHRMAADAGYYHYDAANAAWVRVYINGNYVGVYASTEQRDEQLLRNRDLYSPFNTWLYKIDGGVYNEVGTGDSPTHVHLNFAPFVRRGGGSVPDLAIDLPQWIDMESMLTLAACEAFVEN